MPVHVIPLLTEEELIVAAKSLNKGWAPRPNGLPAEVLQVIALRCPAVLLQMYNACLIVGVFCTVWKRRSVLIDKKKAVPAWWPLCILDNDGKLLEALLRRRIRDAIRNGGDLSDRQYESRKGRSTAGAEFGSRLGPLSYS